MGVTVNLESSEMTNTQRTKASDPNTWRAILAMTALGIIGANMVLILPVVIGGLVDSLGLTSSQAGLVATAEFIGMAVANLAVAAVVHRWNRRTLGFSMLALMIAGNLSSVVVDGFAVLFVTRVICGLSEGALIALMTAGVVSTRSPDRIFGTFLIANLSFAAISFTIIPKILASWGISGAFVWLAGLAILGMTVVHWFPAFARDEGDQSADADSGSSKVALVPAALGLAAMFSFFLCIGAVWPYMERIGVYLGHSVETVGEHLAVASLAGIVGAAMVAWLDIKLGRTIPLIVSIFALAACLILLLHGDNVFFVVVLIFMWAWIVTLTYLTGAMAILDPLGRVASIGVAMQSAGLMFGPALSALFLGENQYLNVAWLGIIFSLLCLALIVPVVLPEDFRMRTRPEIAQ